MLTHIFEFCANFISQFSDAARRANCNLCMYVFLYKHFWGMLTMIEYLSIFTYVGKKAFYVICCTSILRLYSNLKDTSRCLSLSKLINVFNRPIFWGVWNRGIGAVTHWKIFLWKIIHIYIGVVFHQRFFQKGVTKKICFLSWPLLLSKNGHFEMHYWRPEFLPEWVSDKLYT